MTKIGTVTVSVFREEDDVSNTKFYIETDNEVVLPVSYIIEDTLKLY